MRAWAGLGAALLLAGAAYTIAQPDPVQAVAPSSPPPAPARVAQPEAAGFNPAAVVPPAPVEARTITPRMAADRAFNDAMMAHETGRVESAALLRAAIEAYDSLPEVDSDGRFHMAVLRQAAGDAAGALEQANIILEARPTHVLALGVAMESQVSRREVAEARRIAALLLAALPSEQAVELPEYVEHRRMFAYYRDHATETAR